ncbi:hypothetical protein ALP71_01380 [Pseudomonas coronafaciens pv. garcae]|nr:hypothetical protein ALP71_01380 [Pseudomonas coronafaciens pv. garcae]
MQLLGSIGDADGTAGAGQAIDGCDLRSLFVDDELQFPVLFDLIGSEPQSFGE